MTGVMNRPEVLKLFARQHWVASTAQLEQLDVTLRATDRARRRGLVTAVMRGVVQVADVELTFEGRALAAQLGAGDRAFVSGPTAGALHGLRQMPKHRIEVTIPQRRRATLPSWCRLVRTAWINEERDIAPVRGDGLRLATPLRTLFGLAEQFNQHRFERAAEDMWHHQLVSPQEAADYLAAIRRSGRTGVLRFETWLERTSCRVRPSQSDLELDFVEMIERVGLPTPKRQLPLLLATGELIHLDLAWPEVRLAVEPGHSWWHGGDLAQRADQARDRDCAVVGWHVHRYDEAARQDRAATARQLLALYRRRAHDLGHSQES